MASKDACGSRCSSCLGAFAAPTVTVLLVGLEREVSAYLAPPWNRDGALAIWRSSRLHPPTPGKTAIYIQRVEAGDHAPEDRAPKRKRVGDS